VFEHWDSFYLLVGGASGALIGLLFVVATLTTSFNRDQALVGSSVYLAPVVGHFAMILGVSALASAPPTDPRIEGGLVAAAALVGALWSCRSGWIIKTSEQFKTAHWSDYWWFGVWPGVIYVVLMGAAALAWVSPVASTWSIAAVLVVLMMVAIRNAWDLVTWISATINDPKTGQAGTSEEH
jgi:hypothetical protein